MSNLIKKSWVLIFFLLLVSVFSVRCSFAENPPQMKSGVFIDRVQLVTQQVNLLRNRLGQVERELASLQQQHDKQISQLALENASKNLLDKSELDISVTKSNLESINIELTDAQQNLNWLEKNIQEIENQLNVVGVFGLKIAADRTASLYEYRSDLEHQQKLYQLEKSRISYLQKLQSVVSNILQLNKEKYNYLNTLLKTRHTLLVKHQQIKDELAYQELQNYWLNQMNILYARLDKIDPGESKDNKDTYSETERNIFYANESASFAYVKSLMARYKDQIQQMNMAIQRSNSISVLNEIRDQVQVYTKQISRLDSVLKSRQTMLKQHLLFLTQNKIPSEKMKIYLQQLAGLQKQYQSLTLVLDSLNSNLQTLRITLDQALQKELSSRQGFPTFSLKTFLDLGKEILLVPALSFQVAKSLSTHLMTAFEATSWWAWGVFTLVESMLIFMFVFLRNLLKNVLERPSQWRDQLNFKWLSLQWMQRNFIEIFVIGNTIGLLFFFNVPSPHFTSIVYLSLVWLIFRSIMTFLRLCLIETTHDTTGHDVRLYHRLKWIILIGGIITALTVFVHQLPLIYELKTLCDRLFLFLLMIVSILLLRSWDVVPNLILSHMESQHPYFQKSVRLIGILVPVLIFCNAIIGLFGFVNLILTIARYEGIFLIVLIGYLILRGLLSDGMEQLSRLMIQYVNNGWLWTEAFLKPIDKVLRITLFLVGWAVLFLLFGWDKQSPIVERLTRLLHYELLHVLNTTIIPINIIELFVVISIFYWTAKWTREFVYRLLLSRTQDLGIRNSIAILTQYSVIVTGGLICLRVLGIDLRALAVVFGMFAFGIGWGLRDLANNFACGFLILLERPLRVGDIVNINNIEGEVIHIGSRAVTVRTWDHMELVVPNAEIFNKAFTNWTARDNIVRTVLRIKISRYDNPHEIKVIIQNVLVSHKDVLKDPGYEVYLKEMTDSHMEFEIRYYVNIRQVTSRTSVASSVLMTIWDEFALHGIKPPHPQQEIIILNDRPTIDYQETVLKSKFSDTQSHELE